MKRVLIIIFLVVPILISLYVYPWQRLAIWFAGSEYSGSDFLITLLMSFIVIPLAFYGVMSSKEPLRKVAVEMVGAGQIMLLAVIIASLIGAALSFSPLGKAFMATVVGVTLIALAVYQAVSIRVIHRDVKVEGLDKNLRIVHLSDIHLGSRSVALFEKLVLLSNRENPDFVVISGDLVDTSNVTEADIEPVSQINAPVLFSSGNHDTYVHYDEVLAWLVARGVHVLENKCVELSGVQFIGLTDQNNPHDAVAELNKLELSQKPKILSYHRPDIWRLIDDKNIALTLSGHTHRGQIFPFNFLVALQFKEIAGFYQRGRQSLNVSQGCGTWGPTMRLGSRSEVAMLELKGT